MNDRPPTFADVKSMQAALLDCIRSDLSLIVQPDVTSDGAKMALVLATEILAYMAAGLRDYPPYTAQVLPALRTLVDRADRLLRKALPEVPTETVSPKAVSPPTHLSGGLATSNDAPAPAPASELEDHPEFSSLQQRLASVLATLAAARESLPAATRKEVAGLTRAAIEFEYHRQRFEFERATAALQNKGDPIATVEVELTPVRFQAFLAARAAQLQPSPGTVEYAERVPGGFSKDTYRIGLSNGIQGHRRLILRRDLPFGPGENSVVDEFQLLNTLADAGLPVPRPLLVETDASFVGRPFLLFPQLPGKAVFGDWDASAEERKQLCIEVVRLMAKLHRIDPVASGLVPAAVAQLSPQEVVRQYVRTWRDKWRRRQVHPSVILQTAFDWLERNAPPDLPRVSIIHSDISFRNTLIHEGKLAALLDWEFWHLGDPMEDLSYFRLIAEPMVDWSVLMEAYEAAGGEPYDTQRAAFYEVWRSVRNGTTTTTAWNGFLSGAYPASKAAFQGVSLYRLFLRDVADKLSGVNL